MERVVIVVNRVRSARTLSLALRHHPISRTLCIQQMVPLNVLIL